MLRSLSAFAFLLVVSVAQPASAQSRPPNWVALPVNEGGAQMWLDMNNVLTYGNGYYRVVPMRFQSPGQTEITAWVETDCARSANRFVNEVQYWPSGTPNPIPAGEWQFVAPSTPTIAGYLLRAVCGD